MKHHYYIQLIGILFLSSCGNNCNSTSGEPRLNVSFLSSTTRQPVKPEYIRVYAIDGNNQVKGNIEINRGYSLPISTQEDQVTYIFEHASRPNDTLIVTYERIFRFDDDPECGFGMNLVNVALSRRSTFATNNPNDFFIIQQSSNDLFDLTLLY